MPNWCENRITISCDTKEEADEIRNLLWDAEGRFSFGPLIPMPACLARLTTGGAEIDGVRVTRWIEEPDPDNQDARIVRRLTPAEEAEVAATGYRDWYEWAVANWGTKWDVLDPEIEDEAGDEEILVRFDTAWSPPRPWVEALKKRFPKARITAFFDEPGMQIAGYY